MVKFGHFAAEKRLFVSGLFGGLSFLFVSPLQLNPSAQTTQQWKAPFHALSIVVSFVQNG